MTWFWIRKHGADLALGTLIALVTWPVLNTPPSIGLDASWKVGLHMAAQDGMSFGSDILFTFGPLGFLGDPQPYLGRTSALALVFVGVVHVGACIGLFHLARLALGGLAAFALVMATAFTFLWVTGWILYGALIFIVSATAVLRRSINGTGLVFATVLGVAAGISLLGKLNVGFVSFVIAGIGVLGSAHDPRRSALTFGASTLAVFMALWFVLSQDVGDLAAYARGAVEIAAGFGLSMYQVDPQSNWAAGVAALGTGIFLCLVWIRTRDVPRRDRFVLWLLVGAMVLAAFKGGFTRQGLGMAIYLVILLSVWPAVVPRNLSRVAMAMPVAGILAMVLALTSLPIATLADPVARLQAAVQQMRTVLIERHQATMATASALRSLYALPDEVVALLAGHSADIQPWQASVAYAYPEIRWSPQPVFQAYAAYTPYLDRQNADLLVGVHAPERVLWLTDPDVGLSIDGRSVWFDSPAAKIEMVCRYLPLASTPEWQVLGRVANRCGPPIPVWTAAGEVGAPVQIPSDLPPGILTIRVSGMGQDFLTRLITLAYAAPPWYITVGGATYRIPLGINGEATIIAANTDVGLSDALSLPPPPDTITIGPNAGAPGIGSPLSLVLEVIPIGSEP